MKNIFKLLIIVLIIVLIIPGCSKKNEEPKEDSDKKEEKKEEIPKQLDELEKDIEKIFQETNGPAVVDKEEEKEQDSQNASKSGEGSDLEPKASKNEQQDTQEKDQSSSEKEQDSDKKEAETDSQQEKQNTENKIKEENKLDYISLENSKSKLAPIIKDMHFKWDSYMPMAVEKGADSAVLENFSNTLNELTTKSEVISNETLVAASNLYGFIPNFYSLYKSKTPPDIKSIRHYTRNSIISSITENWNQADEDIKSLITTWAVLKNSLDDKEKELSKKIDYSISEMEKVVSEKNKLLIDIKGRVLLSNIQEIEKKMEESETQ